MVWFQCEGCGDTLKKPKLGPHMSSCRSTHFTCIDCSVTFDRNSVQAHTSCVTEHQKYALAATKPGGSGAVAPSGGGSGGAVSGLEFLAARPPWTCACCAVTCTSQETLLSHAGGKKHGSKARTAAALASGAAAPAALAPAVEGKRPREEEPAPEDVPQPPAKRAARPAFSSIKWKKLAAKALAAGPLKLKKLRAAVLSAARAAHGTSLTSYTEEELSCALDARLSGSTQFIVAEGVVSLSQ